MKNQYEIDYQQGYDTANDEWLERMDKIKNEIEEHVKINQNLNIDRVRALCWCLDVIDKYQLKSEDKE